MGDYTENKFSLDERNKNNIKQKSNIKQIFEV